MEGQKIINIINFFERNDSMKLFFEKFVEQRNIIFEYIYNLLENSDDDEEEDKKIQEIINQEAFDDDNKIKQIKNLKRKKYSNNYKKNYNSEELKKYNLGLICTSFPTTIQLVFYQDKELKNGNQKNKEEMEEKGNIEEKEEIEEIEIKEEKEGIEIKEENKEIEIKEEKDEIEKKEEKEENENEWDDYKVLMDIDFIVKIKINDEEEWICNAEYALYLIYIKKNLRNPHPYSIEENSDDSSYSLSDTIDIEHFVLITNNKKDRKKKLIAEIKAELNISNIYNEIKKKDTSFTDYMNDYLKNIDLKEINIEDYDNNQIASYFGKLDKNITLKNIIFQDKNILNSFYKIGFLNHLYYQERLRFFYLDLNKLNEIKNANEKRKYLAYSIARIYNCNKEFKVNLKNFVNEYLKHIKDMNFLNNLIDKIIKENMSYIENNNEKTPFYIIIDNIDSEENYHVVERLINNDEIKNVYIYGIINIETNFGKKIFLKLYNKKYTERGEIGFHVHYLNSNNGELVNKNINNLNTFFKDLGNNINLLKDFIQLIYFKKLINECPNINIDFLMNYIKYIKLIIKEDDNNCLHIEDIDFINEEIKKKFILNYKNLLIFYLNKKDDEITNSLFSDVNSIFFEKQIILDILLDKIKSNKQRNLKELNVHSIYCMNLDISKIDFSQYKNKDIILIQDSKTGEIYDFGIIIDNCVKLYQVSTFKSKEDLLKLNKNLIEVDCGYMANNTLNEINEYNNFSFGIITSTLTFNKYSQLLTKKENQKSSSSYYLMKEHCQKNNYELLVYDIKEQKLYVEDDSNKLIEYDIFKFNIKNKLNIPQLKEIFTIKPKKISIKQIKKDIFIEKLNATKLFSGFKNDKNNSSLNLLGKFDYKSEFLDIERIKEDNYFIYISGKTKENKNFEILKHKDDTIQNEIIKKKRVLYEGDNINLTKKKSEVILFNIGKEITFLGKKRKKKSK